MVDGITTTSSWWVHPAVQADRTQFARRVAEELPRMQSSKGATYVDTFHAMQVRERASVGMGGHRKGRFGGCTVSQ